MKFFVAFAALVALTAAVPLGKPVDADVAQLEAIIAAINSPSTDPATAALLEEQLGGIIAAMSPIDVGPAIIPPSVVVDKPEPIAIGPAIIPPSVVVDKPEPIAIGPAFLPPKPDGGAVTAPVVPTPVVPSPVVVGDIPSGQSPLVQIIVNVNKAEAAPVAPVVQPEPVGEIPAEPVQVIEVAPEPVQVVEVAPEPVQVVEVAPEPVQVVEVAPEPVQVVEVVPEPVQIGTPVIPEAAVVLPEELN